MFFEINRQVSLLDTSDKSAQVHSDSWNDEQQGASHVDQTAGAVPPGQVEEAEFLFARAVFFAGVILQVVPAATTPPRRGRGRSPATGWPCTPAS
ncbi:hypothetical protein [Micromonospora sp. NPDC048830]|uniref:hypothetical protein n=1 Tax=Micromonospora sp. NPDC048830 TaxID=3364257 RepID=UPI003722837F